MAHRTAVALAFRRLYLATAAARVAREEVASRARVAEYLAPLVREEAAALAAYKVLVPEEV